MAQVQKKLLAPKRQTNFILHTIRAVIKVNQRKVASTQEIVDIVKKNVKSKYITPRMITFKVRKALQSAVQYKFLTGRKGLFKIKTNKSNKMFAKRRRRRNVKPKRKNYYKRKNMVKRLPNVKSLPKTRTYRTSRRISIRQKARSEVKKTRQKKSSIESKLTVLEQPKKSRVSIGMNKNLDKTKSKKSLAGKMSGDKIVNKNQEIDNEVLPESHPFVDKEPGIFQ